MTVKIDGTNGVLQAYDYQVLTTGFTYTFAAGTQVLVAVPASTLATGTITMPSAPADGMVITIQSTQQITALTVSANTGQTLVGTAIQLNSNQPLSWVYRLTDTTWYPFAGGVGRASPLVSGTSVASTSGTSINFTSIPSWVKRVNVMFSGVSTSGTSVVQIQLGTGATPTYTTSGYTCAANDFSTSPSGTLFTSGFAVESGGAAAYARSGQMIISNITGNTWVESCLMQQSTATARNTYSGGGIALAAALTAVRITTVNGTDTFDAGTLNIQYE